MSFTEEYSDIHSSKTNCQMEDFVWPNTTVPKSSTVVTCLPDIINDLKTRKNLNDATRNRTPFSIFSYEEHASAYFHFFAHFLEAT